MTPGRYERGPAVSIYLCSSSYLPRSVQYSCSYLFASCHHSQWSNHRRSTNNSITLHHTLFGSPRSLFVRVKTFMPRQFICIYVGLFVYLCMSRTLNPVYTIRLSIKTRQISSKFFDKKFCQGNGYHQIFIKIILMVFVKKIHQKFFRTCSNFCQWWPLSDTGLGTIF